MKRLFLTLFYLFATFFLYILIHEFIHLFFCLINPRVEILELHFGINNSVIWIGEVSSNYSNIISYSSNICMFLLPILLLLICSKKCMISHFITAVFIVIDILVLSFSIFISTQQELSWLSSVGLFKYIILLSFIALFFISLNDLSKSLPEGNPKEFLLIFISLILANLTLFIGIKVDFKNHYEFECQVSNQEIYYFEGNVYLLKNDTNSTISLLVRSNLDEVYEVHIRPNQYIKITLLKGGSISFSCDYCESDFEISIYRFIEGGE